MLPKHKYLQASTRIQQSKRGTKKHVPCNIQNCNKQKISCRARQNCRVPHRHVTVNAFAGNTLKHITIHHWLLRLSEYNTAFTKNPDSRRLAMLS